MRDIDLNPTMETEGGAWHLHPAQAEGLGGVGEAGQQLHDLLEVVHLVEVRLHEHVLHVELLLACLQEGRDILEVGVLQGGRAQLSVTVKCVDKETSSVPR